MTTASLDGRTVAEFMEDVKSLTTEIQTLYCSDNIPWIIGWSGGKDSSATLQLVWNAIAALPAKQRTKPISIISTDTQVENPVISAWVQNSLEQIKAVAKKKKLPFEAHLLTPAVQDTFWVNLIGKGYPAPRQKFRWCTERLKIRPSNAFIREQVRQNGETILVLGTRKSESSQRAYTMAKHAERRVRERLSPNATLPNSLIYSPVEAWSSHDVWLYLHSHPCPWSAKGTDLNKELFALYRGATADNECPLVVDTSTPSCGNSRFGCWVCTLVDRDKSMEAMVLNDESKEWMLPLLELRDELDFRSDEKREQERAHRDFRRMGGNVQLFERGTGEETEVVEIPGPYIKSWREELLRKVLTTQTRVRETAPPHMQEIELISREELQEIRRIWREEKHEFDDALPRIYRETTGQIFQDPRPDSEQALLGSDEWQILEELCEGDTMHLELLTKLLNTERQHHLAINRSGILKDLKRCFETSARNKEEAIEAAHRDRDLKLAAQTGDIQTVKQLVEPQRLHETEAAPPATKPHQLAAPKLSEWANVKYGKRGGSKA
jgi:DNA sulfur modification protein DndC